jgi:hypothetical protein
METRQSQAQPPNSGQVRALLDSLAANMLSGDALYAALPKSFNSVGIDPYEAIQRLATREWRISTLLEDLLPGECVTHIRAGEEDADLPQALLRAAGQLERTLQRQAPTSS